MRSPTDISVCVLSYNTKDHLRRCLSSVKMYSRAVFYEVIVVDNGSTDGSVEMVKTEFPTVALIENGENRWYSGGNNDGLRLARGRYIVFCNADTRLVDNALRLIVRWLDRHPSAVAVEPRQVGDDGRIEPTGSLLNRPLIDAIELTFFHRWFSRIPQVRRFRQREKDRTRNFRTIAVSGAFLVARTAAVEKAGGFDERLKLYYTDTDLCRKLLRIGQIWHIGRVTVTHSLSQSTRQLSWWRKSGIYARDALVYYWIVGEKIQGILLWMFLQINRVLVQGKVMLIR